MRQDLDTLRVEVEEAIRKAGFVLFRGASRAGEASSVILWDSERYEDFQDFLEVAGKLGVKLIVFHHRELDRRVIEDALEKLEAAGLERDEHRDYERTLRRLQGYEGFTCCVELTFECDRRTYMYGVTTPWYSEYLELLDELDDALEMSGEDEGPAPLGGFFSKN